MYSGPILWDAACNVHVRALCHASRTIYMGNSTCTVVVRNASTEDMCKGKTQSTEARNPIHKLPPAPKNVHINARACDNVWYKSVCTIIRVVYCVPHVLYLSVGVVHKNMPYNGVQGPCTQ